MSEQPYRLTWCEAWLNPVKMAKAYNCAFKKAVDNGACEEFAHMEGLRAIAIWSQPQNRK